ncbi:Endoplasmic reticulum mannosyl-oligosaccharide 1,2-alpha-mannosidase [Cyphellophora attinorum]|uniref:alpha-1,2-Mannosidase n=1 Tax=Cyphellophora attinorum TaxID=1664694 RepID=A0A0N1GYT2_9EURO|nr:Endoplasmic reticulum mannosyl-oligosaccharide 1,2-alpha-mannosidase [Phialophora attinorum]KPI35942.1 Endoplasmic reticulum mannosyl-oligosaccharide 1,2-alpha-mannosidase [Phialophora attinorum]
MILAPAGIVGSILLVLNAQLGLTKVVFSPSSYDWSDYKYKHALSSTMQLPEGTPVGIPTVQFAFPAESAQESATRKTRQKAVLDTFTKGWASYWGYAWKRDELAPLSGTGKDTFGGWAATLVDALDTLWIMGLKDEFYEAAGEAAKIDWAVTEDTSVNMFETNIRHLGGLLAAYDLSREPALLSKAIELGDILWAGFDTPTHLPPFMFDFKQAKNGKLVLEDNQSSAAIGSFALEFTRLAQVSGDSKYYDAIARVTSLFVSNQLKTNLPGMWPMFINARKGTFEQTAFTLGAVADSFYEYLPKMHYLLGGQEPAYEEAYRDAMETAIKSLLFRPMLPDKDDILVAGSAAVAGGKATLNAKNEHLGCFAGGMFLLSGKLFDISEHVDIGTKLTNGCIYSYDAFPTGIMPEISQMHPCPSFEECEYDASKFTDTTLPKGFTAVGDPKYILRPEAIESVFYLYRITGDSKLQDVASVLVEGKPAQEDSMESFWFAETLKYFYLIFSPPDTISLDDWVFNTEAHPFRRPK